MPRDYYKAVLDILGATGTIIDMGQPPINWNSQAIGENAALTTFVTAKGASGLAATFTYSAARDLWPYTRYKGRGRIPILKSDNSQSISSPDDNYWSRGNGLADSAFTVGMWVRSFAGSPTASLFAKWAALTREWQLYYDLTSRRFALALYDESAAVQALKAADIDVSSGPAGRLSFIVATYDGSGGAAAADGITLYQDKVAVAATATNNASYVAMENLTSALYVYRNGPGGVLNGEMAGGPIGPFYTQKVLSAAEVRSLGVIGEEAQENLEVDFRRRR